MSAEMGPFPQTVFVALNWHVLRTVCFFRTCSYYTSVFEVKILCINAKSFSLFQADYRGWMSSPAAEFSNGHSLLPPGFLQLWVSASWIWFRGETQPAQTIFHRHWILFRYLTIQSFHFSSAGLLFSPMFHPVHPPAPWNK